MSPSRFLSSCVCLLLCPPNRALIFRADQFTDVTQECKSSDGKPLTYILNEDSPALYVSIDPSYPYKSLKKLRRGGDQSKIFSNLADSKILHDIALGEAGSKRLWPNSSFDCVLQIQTELPRGDKGSQRYDALSMIIIELEYIPPPPPEYIQISTFGHEPTQTYKVTKNARYTDRLFMTTNPNFLLSGQLSGFDSSDYRTKVDHQHIIKPENLHSTFDKPASIKVNMSRWNWESNVYMVFTSYKHLRHGERCQEHKEFDCSPPSFLSTSTDHMCMSSNLACDGLPNCGQDFLPNQDENCFKIHWSSVLLSLVSYILLAITLLLCLSCFARVLIQWSVRSSLAELRGTCSPTGSFRSSSRFFSFLGNTFSNRWERPPPSYDEAMKHVNPDLARPQEPPAYSDTFNGAEMSTSAGGLSTTVVVTGVGNAAGNASGNEGPGGGGNGNNRPGTSSIVETPPPDYEYQDQQQQQQQNLQSQYPFLGSSSSSMVVSSSSQHLGHLRPSVVVLPPSPSVAYTRRQHQSSFESASIVGGQAPPYQPPMSPADCSSSDENSAAVAAKKVKNTTTIEAEICPPN